MAFVTDSNPPQYNGYTFPVSVETVQFDQEPVQDEADRTTLYIRYRIGLSWKVTGVEASAANIDSYMASLRQTLMKRGKVFTYANRGFGADWIVGPGSLEDVCGGPKPVAFSFKPLGQNKGCRVSWTVELCLPSHCTYSVFGVMMTFNYRLRLHINRHGYTTRTYTGFLAVPKLEDYHDIINADQFLENVIPPVPAKFQRTDKDFDHSLDKTRCDFTFTDEELVDAMLPEGCTEASASHDVGSSFSRGFMQWDGTISGRYTIAPPYSIEVGWKAFKDLVKTRLNFINGSIDTGDFNGDVKLEEQKPGQKPICVLTGLRVGEPDIYKSTAVTFSVTFMQISTLKAIIGSDQLGTGQWKFPSKGIDAWNAWNSSITKASATRGLAGIKLDPSSEIIVNLCSGESTATPPITQEADFVGGDLYGPIGDVSELQPDPDKERSWFIYESELEVYEDQHAYVHSQLSEEGWNPYDKSPGDVTDEGYRPDDKPSDPSDTVQYRAPSTLYVYISGQAMRAWFPIPRPKIVSYNGFQVKEVSTQPEGCFFRQKNVGSLGIGMPIYYAEWRFRYAVTDRPTAPIRPPVNLSEQN